MENPAEDSMKLLAAVLAITTLPLLAQVPVRKPPTPPTTPVPSGTGTVLPIQPVVPGSPTFTPMEQKTANDIAQMQQSLQELINSFMQEVRMVHPGYYFANGLLQKVPEPTKPAEKPAEKK
jgi:hypothetical protein